MKQNSDPAKIQVTPTFDGFLKKISDFQSTLPPIPISVELNDEKFRSDLSAIRTSLAENSLPLIIPIKIEQGDYQKDLNEAQNVASEASESMKLPSERRFENLARAVQEASAKFLDLGASMELSNGQSVEFDSKLSDIALTLSYAAEQAEKYAAALKSVKGINGIEIKRSEQVGSSRLPGEKYVNAMHKSKLRGASTVKGSDRVETLDSDIQLANEKRKAYIDLLSSGNKDFDTLSAAYKEYTDALSIAEKSLKQSLTNQKNAVEAAKNSRAELEKYLSKRRGNKDSDDARSNKLLFSDDDEYKKLYENVKNADSVVKSLGNDITEIDSGPLEKLAEAYRALDSYVDKARSKNYIEVGNKNEAAKLNNLNLQIERYLALNTKVARDPSLSLSFAKLSESVKNATTTYPEASKQFSELKVAAEDAGLASQSLIDRLKKLFNDHLKTAVVMAGLHLLQTGLRNIYQSVVDIDTAMTNLRKVSSGTTADYDRFLSGAAARAKDLGATMSDVIDASAEFSRLGYSLD